MSFHKELNLDGVVSPICLLELKHALKDMAAGQILCVRVQDSQLVPNILTIVERSTDRVLNLAEEGSDHVIEILKG